MKGFRLGVRLRQATVGPAAPRFAIAVCALLASACADRATAADWPLRGSVAPSYARWDGWQVGVQAGFGNMNTDFGTSTSSQIAFILRNSTLENEASPSDWTTLPATSTNGPVFGGFIGYNVQWSELVVGFDLAYNHPSIFQTSVGDSINRIVTTSDGVTNDVTISAQSMIKLVDYATLRARAGYAFSQFLPYAVIGFAAGRFNQATGVTVTVIQTPPAGPPTQFGPVTAGSSKDNAIVGGVAAGLGIDWAVTPNVFLRAEWEYITFAPVNDIRTNINTGQVGVGLRF
jgi:opacity protein-like surface antigen